MATIKKMTIPAILISLFFSFSALAQESRDIYKIQQTLERRITSVVKTYDADSSVFIQVRKRIRKVKLPLTPYTLRAEIIDINGKLKLGYMKVTIISSLSEIPPSLDKVIREIGSDYGIRKRVKIEQIKVLATTDSNPVAKILEKDFDSRNLHISSFFEKEKKWFLAFGAGLVFLLLSIVLSRGSSNKIKNVFEEQMSKLNSSLEGLGNLGAAGTRATEDVKQSSAITQIEVNSSSSQIWEDLESASLKAIFFDCYWCENDGYAKFIWQKIPIEEKVSILNANYTIRNYAHYIVELGAEDLNFIHDPYYLDPLEVNHLNNASLTKLMKNNPVIFNKISKMRLKKLNLRAIEYLNLVNGSTSVNDDVSLPDFKGMPPSIPRELKWIKRFVFKSTDEELEIINKKDLSHATMSCFPSLAWGLKLSDDTLKDIFSSYTAKQLAFAWIAPKNILIELRHIIPKKKVELLESYKDTIEPSRNSEVYLDITMKILKELKKLDGNQIENHDEKKVA